MVGNAVEIDESLEILSGQGPEDLRELVLALAGEIVLAKSLATSDEEARALLIGHLDSGRALAKFADMVAAQGGDLDAPRPRAPAWTLTATKAGYVTSMDAQRLGLAIVEMGGGRKQLGRYDRSQRRVGDARAAGRSGRAGAAADEHFRVHGRALPRFEIARRLYRDWQRARVPRAAGRRAHRVRLRRIERRRVTRRPRLRSAQPVAAPLRQQLIDSGARRASARICTVLQVSRRRRAVGRVGTNLCWRQYRKRFVRPDNLRRAHGVCLRNCRRRNALCHAGGRRAGRHGPLRRLPAVCGRVLPRLASAVG